MFRLLTATVLPAVLATASMTSADVTVASVLDILMENVSIRAEEDGRHRLYFRLVNDSPIDVVLLGIEAADAEAGELTYYSHHNSVEPVEALILQPDEEADFSTSHLRARLEGLDVTGDRVPFRLIFRRGWIEGEAHVH